MNDATQIRPATEADVEAVFHIRTSVRENHLSLEQMATMGITPDAIREAIAAEPCAWLAEADGKAVGFAVYFFNYSTWQGQHGLYLEDLYITPDARGHGAGKALLQHLARIALEKDCGRFEWSCLDWNTPSIKFYDSLGALPQTEWIRYRMTGSALQAMATGDKQA